MRQIWQAGLLHLRRNRAKWASAMGITVDELLRHPAFAGMSRVHAEQLVAAGKEHWAEDESQILAEGDPANSFFVLVTGTVKVYYTSPQGLEVVAKVFRGPAVFGEMECLSAIPYLESVQAIERSHLWVIPREDLLATLARSHAFTRSLLNDVAARLCIAAQNERSLAFDPVEVRLAHLLLTYADLFGLPDAEGTLLRVPLSQDELARALGVTRRSVTRTLAAWAQHHLLVKRGRRLVLRSLAELREIGQGSGPPIGYHLDEPMRARTPRPT